MISAKKVIYKIENLINKKVYVGQTCNVARRFSNHKIKLDRGVHSNPHLQAAWNKYGSESFVFKVIEVFNPELNFDINAMEKYWIKKLKSTVPEFGYNKLSGGDGGGSPNQETREKLRVANTGRKQSLETRKKRSKSMIGKQNRLGKKHSEKTKKLMSIAKSKKMGWEPHPNSLKAGLKNLKPADTRVVQKSIEVNSKKIRDDLGNIFSSITKAALFYKTHKSNITAVCKGIRKTANGRSFKYVC